jgi:hypothetical protein
VPEPKETLTPASYQLRLDLNSAPYNNAIEHLRHFKNTMPLFDEKSISKKKESGIT